MKYKSIYPDLCQLTGIIETGEADHLFCYLHKGEFRAADNDLCGLLDDIIQESLIPTEESQSWD